MVEGGAYSSFPFAIFVLPTKSSDLNLPRNRVLVFQAWLACKYAPAIERRGKKETQNKKIKLET